MNPLLTSLVANLRDTVTLAIEHAPPKRALIVYDEDSSLARLVTDGYRCVLPDAGFVDFNQTTPDSARAMMDACSPGDLVVLIQSTSFRLNDFRFRLELFNRSLAVIEHPHLGRMVGAQQEEIYVDALAYDTAYYRGVGSRLKSLIDGAKRIVVSCEGTELVYDGPFESSKLNTGDYAGMKNVGGQFPIGEVFTEPVDLSRVNGTVKIFAFADEAFSVVTPDLPMTATIQNGILVDVEDGTPTFDAVLDRIRTTESLTVRELGFGMNRAMTRHRILTDIGSYERMCGIHLSLGAKHTIFAKPGFPKRTSRYHVDVFADVTSVAIDGDVVFANGSYS